MTGVIDSIACRVTRIRLASGSPGGEHLRSCLACQAEEAKYRSLRRQLAALREDSVSVPPRLRQRVEMEIADIPQDSGAPARSRTVAIAGASSVAAAVVAWVVMVLARRRAHVA